MRYVSCSLNYQYFGLTLIYYTRGRAKGRIKMLLHPAISWYDACLYFANCFWEYFCRINHFELHSQKRVFKGINYCELALFPNIKDCEFNKKKVIMKGFKWRLLKHTYVDLQQGPRKQFNCTISDRILFNQTNNQLI